jgi:hypothetical protein
MRRGLFKPREAPEPLYSSRDDWREATEKLIAYRDLGA